jgi:hypothetical protein
MTVAQAWHRLHYCWNGQWQFSQRSLDMLSLYLNLLRVISEVYCIQASFYCFKMGPEVIIIASDTVYHR